MRQEAVGNAGVSDLHSFVNMSRRRHDWERDRDHDVLVVVGSVVESAVVDSAVVEPAVVDSVVVGSWVKLGCVREEWGGEC